MARRLKVFHVRDGSGIVAVQRAGIAVAIISGRDSPAVHAPRGELGIRHVRQGVADKRAALDELLRELRLDRRGSWPAWATTRPTCRCSSARPWPSPWQTRMPTARAAAHWTTPSAGGHGAVREVCDLLLTARGT